MSSRKYTAWCFLISFCVSVAFSLLLSVNAQDAHDDTRAGARVRPKRGLSGLWQSDESDAIIRIAQNKDSYEATLVKPSEKQKSKGIKQGSIAFLGLFATDNPNEYQSSQVRCYADPGDGLAPYTTANAHLTMQGQDKYRWKLKMPSIKYRRNSRGKVYNARFDPSDPTTEVSTWRRVDE